MSTDIAVLDQWATSWSSHDVDRVLRLFTDNCVYEDVPTCAINTGKDALRTFAQFFFSVAPDFKIELSKRFETDKWAAGEWTMSGTQKGAMPNLPATGKPFSIRQWVKAGHASGARGVLFLPYTATQIAALSRLISAWAIPPRQDGDRS